MQNMKRSLLQKGESELSSCVSIEVQSIDGKLKLIDLLKDDGSVNGSCWLEAGEAFDFDNTEFLFDAFLALENKEKNTESYKSLKEYVKGGCGEPFKKYKKELKVMFEDAYKLGMFGGVLKPVKIN